MNQNMGCPGYRSSQYMNRRHGYNLPVIYGDLQVSGGLLHEELG